MYCVPFGINFFVSISFKIARCEGMRNLTNVRFWNPEFRAWNGESTINTESRIHRFRWNLRSISVEEVSSKSEIQDSGSRIHYSGSGIHGLGSGIREPPEFPLHRAIKT